MTMEVFRRVHEAGACYERATMYTNQAIQRALGVTAFGSSLLRVDPDYASLRFAVTRVGAKPKDAFGAARAGAATVREAVRKLGVADSDVREGDITLEEAWEGYNQDRKMVGYRATVAFQAIVHDFATVEPMLVAVVEAGADRIHSVHPKTKRLKELRRDARVRAVHAAQAKAEVYAAAAGAKLGAALHIEDVNPEDISRRSHLPDVDLSEHADAEVDAYKPGTITVAGAVLACFALVR
jgi:uncharacterized protein